MSVFLRLLGFSAVTLWSVQFTSAQAQSLYWNVASGDFGTVGNYVDAPVGGATVTAFPANGTGDYFLQNGTLGAEAEASIVNNPANRNIGSLMIGQYNTLIFSGISATGTATSIRNNGNLVNAGLITSGLSATDNIVLQLNHTEANAPNVTNTGIIQAEQGYLRLESSHGNLINTDGLLLAKAGATLSFGVRAIPTPYAIQNGTLRSEVGGFIEVGGAYSSNVIANFDGVIIDNQGAFNTTMVETLKSGARTVNTVLKGSTILTNTGTTLLQNTGDGHSAETPIKNPEDPKDKGTPASPSHSARFDINDDATFTNTGTLTVRNDTTRTSDADTFTQQAVFSINSANATFTNTGTIEVFHDTTLANTSTTFTSVKSIENAGLVHIRGNVNGEGADFTVTGGGEYSQTVADARTVLERGGVMNVGGFIQIDAGDFGGVGSVEGLGTTVIGTDGRLVVGDTVDAGVGAGALVFDGDLWLDENATVVMALGSDTAGSGRVVIGNGYGLEIYNAVALSLRDLDGSATVGTTYRLFDLDGGSVSGSFVLDLLPTGWAGHLDIGSDYVDFTLTSTGPLIPEPSSAALIMALGVSAVVAGRRRAKRSEG